MPRHARRSPSRRPRTTPSVVLMRRSDAIPATIRTRGERVGHAGEPRSRGGNRTAGRCVQAVDGRGLRGGGASDGGEGTGPVGSAHGGGGGRGAVAGGRRRGAVRRGVHGADGGVGPSGQGNP